MTSFPFKKEQQQKTVTQSVKTIVSASANATESDSNKFVAMIFGV